MVWLKNLIHEQERDRAEYSRLSDKLRGKDSETDKMLDEINKLQIEIIQALTTEVING